MPRVIGIDERLRREVTCRNCASRLEYYPYEIQEETHRDYGGGTDTYTFINCVGCGKRISVNRR